MDPKPKGVSATRPNARRKVRSRVYARSDYAIKEPLMPDELSFARAQSGPYTTDAFLIHAMEVKGKETNLRRLRADMIAAQKKKL